jgi:transposase-like protein
MPQQRHRKQNLIGTDVECCLFCQSTAITRKGKRYKRHETVQLWYCHPCDHVFSPQRTKGKTYPLPAILEGLTLYYRGHSIPTTAKRLKERFGLAIAARTLSVWLAEHKPLTTYARLREAGKRRYTPHQLIRSVRLHHQQVYMFRIHRAKLDLLLDTREHRTFTPIASYLTDMAEQCPHHLFQTEARASQGKVAFNLDAVEIKAKHNLAQRIAGLALQTTPTRKRRHDTLQRFMLLTDAATVAVEVSIYLTPEDLRHMQTTLGFDIPLATDTTLTGHIDILQIRNGAIHILDYKPNAAKAGIFLG